MTYEQAKERFENFGNFCDDYNEACDGDCEMCSDMEQRIIEALDKQIPKKPIKVRCTNGRFSYLCPVCNIGLLSMCGCQYNGCGQAIDWSEEE